MTSLFEISRLGKNSRAFYGNERMCEKGPSSAVVPLVGRKDAEKLVYEQVRDFTRGDASTEGSLDAVQTAR